MTTGNSSSVDFRRARFLQPIWLQRFATAALVLGAYATGVWADLMRGRRPDYFDVQTAIMAMIFAWVAAEVALPAIARLPARGASLALAAGLGVIYATAAHAIPTFLAGLLQVPLGGPAMAVSTIDGLLFTIRQAWLPALVCGLLSGVLCRLLLQARLQEARARASAGT